MKISRVLLVIAFATLLGSLGCGASGNSAPQPSLGIPQSQSSSASPDVPSQAQTFQALQNTMSWRSCNAATCAGGSGTGTYSLQQDQASPSLSGSSMKLDIAGVWANALWWNKLGPKPDATNFVWDFDFQLDDASLTAAQALEFDLFQFLAGYNYMMGSQCNYASGYWDLWDAQNRHWRPTATTCPKFAPGVWHHTQWFAQRSPGTTNYTFVTLTVDGVAYPMNQSYSAKNVGWMDRWACNISSTSTQADKPTLSGWTTLH